MSDKPAVWELDPSAGCMLCHGSQQRIAELESQLAAERKRAEEAQTLAEQRGDEMVRQARFHVHELAAERKRREEAEEAVVQAVDGANSHASDLLRAEAEAAGLRRQLEGALAEKSRQITLRDEHNALLSTAITDLRQQLEELQDIENDRDHEIANALRRREESSVRKCAEIADKMSDEARAVYKGRKPEEGFLRRGDPYADGWSDGAGAAATSIRAAFPQCFEEEL